MKILNPAYLCFIAVMIAAPCSALAADKVDVGKREYEANCAGCHGATGKGDGPYNAFLNKSSSNLTVLAKNNGGVFPIARIYEVIDGRQEVKYHGTREMPIWGSDYQAKAQADSGDMPYDAEVFVRARIVALTDYLYRLQAK